MTGHANNAKGGHTSQSGWTDERVAELRRLVTIEGYSAARAAESLSEPIAGIIFTRNSVIGKARRMGILLNENHGKAGAHTVREKRPLVERRAPPRPVAQGDVVAEPPKAEQPQAPFLRIPITELNELRCHWPEGDPKYDAANFGFCGQPVEPGKSYCPCHWRASRAVDQRRVSVAA
jgi:GcrA cell cycle regulator